MRTRYSPITLEFLERALQEQYAYSTKEEMQKHVKLWRTVLQEALPGAMQEGNLFKDSTTGGSTK